MPHFIKILIFSTLLFDFCVKFHIQNQISSPKAMIMNEFLSQVQRQMLEFRKKNLNTINQFKIQMFQARRNIQRNIIKLQFGISESQLLHDQQLAQNISIIQKESRNNKNDKTLSTNHNSRALESKMNDNCQISRFTNNLNKENQDPNRRMHSDISIIEEFPVKYSTLNSHEDLYNNLNLDSLKNDESMEINTEEVRKKYQKFISPSAGWTMSADPQKEKAQNKHFQQQITPFCEYFAQQDQNFDEEENLSFRKDTDMFGFKEINDCHFSRTNTIHELQNEENNESQNY